MGSKKKKQKNKQGFYNTYFATPLDENTYNQSPMLMNMISKALAENTKAVISPEMSHHERNNFMEHKMLQGEQFKQYHTQSEKFMLGATNALYDNYVMINNLKEKIHHVKKNHKSSRDSIQSLIYELDMEKEVLEKLTNQFPRFRKQQKKTILRLETMEKILVYMGRYLGICDKNTPIKELVYDWKHYNKNHKPQIN